MTASREMPKYQCHKQVWALKIKTVAVHASGDAAVSDAEFQASDAFQGAQLIPVEDGYAPFPVSADWFRKHKPEAGGYFVVYEDGYKSYSPASAFESGYTPCAPGPVVFGDEEHVAVPRGLIGAACSVIDKKRDGTKTLAELRRYTFGDKSQAISPAASTALPVVDPGPDSLEREIQAKASSGPRVTPADIEAEISSEHYFTAADGVQGAYRAGGDVHPVGGTPSQATRQALGLLTFCVLVLRNGFTVIGHSACASPENFNAEIGRRIARENAEREIWPLLGFRLRDGLARSGEQAAVQ